MTDFESLVSRAIESRTDEDLFGYAARAALSELQENWRAAIRDGAKPAALVTDIDLVIGQLRRVRDAIGTPAAV